MKSSLAPNTALTYSRAWSSFTAYSTSVYKQVLNLPISPADICLFVAYLHNSGKAPKTISTYLSALGYIHKITGLSDPTTSFIVSKLMAGAYRSRPSFDLRLPITIAILDQLVDALNHTVPTLYDIQLFKAMYLFAFYTFARIGELTTNILNPHSSLQLSDIETLKSASGDIILVTFRQYKHNVSGPPHKISFGHGPSKMSPVQALKTYLQLRGSQPGPLFCSITGQPISRHAFDCQLHKTLKFCHLDGSKYKGHSFRIGAATYRAELGDSDAQIRSLGRWHSNAFLKYIRTHNH